MSQNPSLDQYPGYFPASKPPFWNRTKAAVAAGVGGLVIGLLATAGSPAATEEPDASGVQESPTAEPTEVDIDGEVEAAVAEETARLQDEMDRQREAAQARLEKAKARAERAQQRAVRQAVAKTRATERERAARAVAAAQEEAANEAPVPFVGSGGTDPRFSYCYEVNDAGYGPYHQGQDPEYDWYDDADGDGVVCE